MPSGTAVWPRARGVGRHRPRARVRCGVGLARARGVTGEHGLSRATAPGRAPAVVAPWWRRAATGLTCRGGAVVALQQLEFWHLPARPQRARGSVTTRPFELHPLRSASTAAARAAQAPVEGATAPMAGEPRAHKRAASTSSCPDQLVRGEAVPSLSPGAKRMGRAHPLAPSHNPFTRPRAPQCKGRREGPAAGP